MSLFILVFFSVYSLFHLYIFLKARAAFNPGTLTSAVIIVFMAVMVCAPVIIRLSEKNGFEAFARFMSYIGYTWLGFIFLLVCSSIVVDLYRSVLFVYGYLLKKDISALLMARKTLFLIPLFAAIAITCYGYFEALSLRTEHVIIKTPKIQDSPGRLRIVQISDVHLGLIVGKERLMNILQKVKESDPDILVSTGDLVDGQINRLEGLAELFHEVHPKYGKFAILGNHEYYAGLDQAMEFIKKAGFRLLRAEAVSVGDLITIAGVDDPAGKYYRNAKKISEKDILSNLQKDKFTLFLKHRPQIDTEVIGLFDLQLSGHAHKGQIFPFSIATWFYYPIHAGCLNPLNGCYIYVSRGTGTWGPPIRFLSPPEITVIDLVFERN